MTEQELAQLRIIASAVKKLVNEVDRRVDTEKPLPKYTTPRA